MQCTRTQHRFRKNLLSRRVTFSPCFDFKMTGGGKQRLSVRTADLVLSPRITCNLVSPRRANRERLQHYDYFGLSEFCIFPSSTIVQYTAGFSWFLGLRLQLAGVTRFWYTGILGTYKPELPQAGSRIAHKCYCSTTCCPRVLSSMHVLRIHIFSTYVRRDLLHGDCALPLVCNL